MASQVEAVGGAVLAIEGGEDFVRGSGTQDDSALLLEIVEYPVHRALPIHSDLQARFQQSDR